MPPISIRPAAVADLDQVLALLAHLHEHDLPAPDPAVLARTWAQILECPLLHCLVAELDGRPAGTCLLAVVPNLTRGARPFAVIENVVAHPSARGRGLGSKLVRHALDLAWEKGCYKAMIQTDPFRPGIDAFYERLGFVRGVKNALVARPPSEK
jgi:GNAT superfamily N-acetyltransferase